MEDRLQQIRQRSSQILDRLSPGQKVALLVLSIMIIASLIGLGYVTTKTEYATLYSGVDEKFGGQVVEALKAKKVEYQVDGSVIKVPADRVAELRMALVSEGIVSGGGIGYELIDKNDMFGVPDEIIQLNKHRMLEGELSRSIQTVQGVKGARVHLAVPKSSLFVEDKRPASASVILELAPGMTLGKSQVRSIVELVAGAVPGMEPERVNVVDNQGRVLNRYTEDLVGGQDSAEYQQTFEQILRNKAKEVIEPIVGPGNVEIVVSSKMDFSREERTEELYDPDKQVVRSEETLSEERENGGRQVGGPAGDNTAQGVVRVGDASSSTREKVSTNYEINKVTKRVLSPVASLQRLSVAVVVNSKARGDNAPAISEEDLNVIRDLVSKAVEFNKDRGDQLTVYSKPFQQAALNVVEVLSAQERQNLVNMSIRYGLILLISLVVLFLAYKLMKFLTSGTESAEVLQDGQLPPGEDQLALPGAELLDELDEDDGPLLEKIREYAKKNPEKAVAVIRYWLSPVDSNNDR
jgi:flagellar M-ring protein FliF